MALETYGDKPISFQLEKNGEYYCFGSDVGRYIGIYKNLYNTYPGLSRRRIMSQVEKEKLGKLRLDEHFGSLNTFLLRASEVEDIYEGNGHKYKIASQTNGDEPVSFQLEKNGEYYYFGSDVGRYLGIYKNLYNTYPGLFRRRITSQVEKKKLGKLRLDEHFGSLNTFLLRASEVEDIYEGNGHKYKIASQTNGDEPVSFQLEKNGEYYCLGSQVVRYLRSRCFYKTYIGLFKRRIKTENERNILVKLGLHGGVFNAPVHVLRTSEVKDIIEGNGDKYTTASIHSTKSPRKCKDRRSMASATTSSHLNAPLSARQIKRKRLPYEKVSITLSRCDDRNPLANMKTAEPQDIPMPLRSNEEIEARRLGDISIWNNNANGTAKLVSREDFIATEIEEEKTEAAVNSSQLKATYNQKCRVCLKNPDQFLELFGSDGVLPLKIMALASVKIEQGDGLPSVICVPCHQLLDISYNFKCLVEKSDAASRALLIYSSLFTEMKINHNAVKGSLAQSVTNDFVMQYESQLLPPENNDHRVSNDYNNLQDSAAHEINKECMNGSNHSHKKGPEDENKDNDLDNEKQAEKDDNLNESEIIPMFNRSEVLLEDQGLSVSQPIGASIPSMKSKPAPIERQKLLLPKVIDLSEEEDNHHEAETEIRYTCYLCEKQFSDIAELMNHVTNSHESLNNQNRVDIDNNCGRVETDRRPDKLDKDIGGSIDEQKVDKKYYKFKCTVCAKEFTLPQLFLSHIKTHPGHEGSGTSDDHFGRLEKTKESWKHPNNLFNSKMNESDDNNSPFEGLQCIHCGILFPTKGILRRHILRHNNVRFNCSICGKEFSHPDELKDHQQSKHKGEILDTSHDKDYDTVNERKKETECRPHERAMCPKVPTLHRQVTT